MIFRVRNRIIIFILFLNFYNPFLFAQNDTSNIDVKLFRLINNSRGSFGDAIAPYVVHSVIPATVLVPGGLILSGRLNKNYYDENTGILTGLSSVTATGITVLFKNIIKRPRPFAVLSDVKISERDKFATDKYSFPSGHTASSFSLATSLTLRYSDKPLIVAGSYLYASLVSIGRIYQGVHYPSDVLVGIITGAGSAALIYSLRKEIITAKNNLFKEYDYPDSNSDKQINETLLLGSFIVSDLINRFLFENNSAMNVSVNSTGSFSGFSFNMSF